MYIYMNTVSTYIIQHVACNTHKCMCIHTHPHTHGAAFATVDATTRMDSFTSTPHAQVNTPTLSCV